MRRPFGILKPAISASVAAMNVMPNIVMPTITSTSVTLALTVALVRDDRDRRRRAEPVRAGLRHLDRVLDVAHATGSFDAEIAADDRAHHRDVLDGRAALAKAGRRLDERSATELRQ